MIFDNTIQQQTVNGNWIAIITYLKSPECVNVHKWYSVSEGWAYLSYKSVRMRIDRSWSLEQVKELVSNFNS